MSASMHAGQDAIGRSRGGRAHGDRDEPGQGLLRHPGETKLDLVLYYLAVGPGALKGVFNRPTVLKRFPHGAEGDFFYQKRVPAGRPPWIETVTSTSPVGAAPRSCVRSMWPTSPGPPIWGASISIPGRCGATTSTTPTSSGSTSTRNRVSL